MNIKALFMACVVMTAQSVLGFIEDKTVKACSGRCLPRDQLNCESPYKPAPLQCESKVCCPKQGKAKCTCYKSDCPNGWEEDENQRCARCCNKCDCVPKNQECDEGTVESKGIICKDSNEFYKECCRDGFCECIDVHFHPTNSCPSGYEDMGVCKSCCYTSWR